MTPSPSGARRTLAGALIAAALWAAGCAPGTDPATTDDRGRAGDTIAAEVAGFDLVAGRADRFIIGVWAADRTTILAHGTIELAFTHLDAPEASADRPSVSARFLPLPGQGIDPAAPGPQLVSGADATGVYGAPDVTFEQPGFWEVTVTATVDGRHHATTTAFEVHERSDIPAVGDPAPRTRQPLAGDPDADPRAIDSRAGPDRPIPVSRAGDAFNTVALVVLVFQLTGSGLGVAGAVMFEVAPVLLLAPLAGLAADRLPRRRLMVGADLFRAACALVLVAVTDQVAVAYAVAFGLSAGAVVFNPAAGSLLPEMVDEDDVVTANSALWSTAVVAQIALAPTAGVVIAVYGVQVAFAVNAATFVVSALLLAGLRAGRTPADIAVRGWDAVLGGVRAVRDDPLLARLAVVQVLAALSAGATGGLLVVLAERWLGVGPGGFGALLAAIGAGAALGPALFRRRIRSGDRRWLFGPFAVRGGVDLTLAAVPNAAVAGTALVAYGMSTSTGMVAYQSTLQTLVPAATRGRAFAFYDVAWNTSRLVSLALGGLVADLLHIRVVYLLGAALLLTAAAVGFTTPRHDTSDPDGPSP